MKEFNIAIDYSELMGEEERESATSATMLAHVKEIIENSILSSLEDVNIQGRRFINGVTQRKVDRILDAIDASEDGKLIMPDKRGVLFQELWTDRLSAPAGGAHRKLMQMIDRRICPDAYKTDEDADDATD